MTSKFEGTERYVATEDLMMAVNAAVTLARPLLVKGEPGTGKTQLAEEIALALDKPLYRWHVKSTTKAQHGLYEYDAVSRLRAHAAKWPGGWLEEERAALLVEALQRAGDHAQATRALEELRAHSPRSPALPRLGRLLAQTHAE